MNRSSMMAVWQWKQRGAKVYGCAISHHRDARHDTDLVIVQVTVGSSIMFITTHVLQEFIADRTLEAVWVPPLIHGADNATNDGSTAPTAREAIGTHGVRGARRGRETALPGGATTGARRGRRFLNLSMSRSETAR